MLITTDESPSGAATAKRPTLSSWLRTQTGVEHRAVERHLDLDRPLTAAEAMHFLTGWASVWREVRRAMDTPGASTTAATELAPMADQALAWLTADGVAPGAPTPGAPEAPGSRRLGLSDLLVDPAAAWGVSYVLHGSRLGGAVLAPRVDAALVPFTGAGSAFLRTAGADPGREWVAFRRRLDASGARRSDAVTAARWTFGWVCSVLAAAPADRLAAGTR